MSARAWSLGLLLALVLQGSLSALNHNPASIRGLAQAFGFILGQEYSLAKIAQVYPDMGPQVELARAQFSTAFPSIARRLEDELTAAVGAERTADLKKESTARISAALASAPMTRDVAAEFLEEVGQRASGKIQAPVLQYMLALKYSDSPVGEFQDRWRQRFSTDGHAKARGLKLTMQLPLSWEAAEGERPHIVQKWTSESGTGLEVVTLDVRPVGGPEPSRAEVEDLVRSGEVKDSLPQGATFVDSGLFSLEGRRGYWVQMRTVAERAGVSIHQGSYMYQFFFGENAVGIMCSVGRTPEAAAAVDAVMMRIRPLCQQIVNSVVLEQAWK